MCGARPVLVSRNYDYCTLWPRSPANAVIFFLLCFVSDAGPGIKIKCILRIPAAATKLTSFLFHIQQKSTVYQLHSRGDLARRQQNIKEISCYILFSKRVSDSNSQLAVPYLRRKVFVLRQSVSVNEKI